MMMFVRYLFVVLGGLFGALCFLLMFCVFGPAMHYVRYHDHDSTIVPEGAPLGFQVIFIMCLFVLAVKWPLLGLFGCINLITMLVGVLVLAGMIPSYQDFKKQRQQNRPELTVQVEKF